VILEATVADGDLVTRVWGSVRTPVEVVERAVEDTRWWTGQYDEPERLDEAVGRHDLLRRLLREVGEVRLGRTPRVAEALGRSIIHQLVQSPEAARSVAQIVARFGQPAPGGLGTWPAAARLGRIPAWELRRCGVSLRGARSLHAAAVQEARLEDAAARGMSVLDERLRSLPGVGVWTSAETRLALGDPDAVSVGDYHLHTWVSHSLGGLDPTDSSDEIMLDLLNPFAGQRGRVITLIGRAYAQRLLPRPPRRAARAAMSAHRYW
jgi:3-methyladenine DNA glycosylase/8-oxoguanine DNA glycosylase